MSDKRIIDLEAKQTLGSGDYLAADSAQGTYKVDANTNIMTPLANVRNNVANSSASPDKYSSSTAYKVGDMVIQNDILYKCTTACSAASWAVNSACFTATTLASVVTQLNSDLTTLRHTITNSSNKTNAQMLQSLYETIKNYDVDVFAKMQILIDYGNGYVDIHRPQFSASATIVCNSIRYNESAFIITSLYMKAVNNTFIYSSFNINTNTMTNESGNVDMQNIKVYF